MSDIHANLDALKAVSEALQSESIDHTICLGDIVGYGPEPAQCLEMVRRGHCCLVAGNHDYAVTGKLDIETFNPLARESAEWTREQLSAEAMAYLDGLPLVSELDGFTIVHGSLHAPELFDYVQTLHDAYLALTSMDQALCFYGHSHVPVAFLQRETIAYQMGQQELRLGGVSKAIINAGSVGQPRDSDPRASFVVFDSEANVVSFKRVPYDVEATMRKIKESGLPRPLGERLRIGR
jgi:predicted phosphodiesterase